MSAEAAPPTTIPAIGEAQVDSDGVISGWCYCPARPEERVSVEILINETLAATVVASRFLEDLRNRGIGDGYYGFSVTLTRQLNRMGETGIVRAREQRSQFCFWHWVRGDFSLPAGFEARLAAATAALAAAAARLPAPAPLGLAPAFSALGRQLSGQGTDRSRPAGPSAMPFSLVAPRRAAGAVPGGAALVLFGDEAGAMAADDRAQICLHLPGSSLAAQRRLAMAAAGGTHLALCGARLPAALPAPTPQIVIAGGIAAFLQRLLPDFAARPLPPGAAAGLLLLVPRATYHALDGLAPDFDEAGDLAIADFALRAAAAGHPIDMTDEVRIAPAGATAAAAAAFFARWRPALA